MLKLTKKDTSCTIIQLADRFRMVRAMSGRKFWPQLYPKTDYRRVAMSLTKIKQFGYTDMIIHIDGKKERKAECKFCKNNITEPYGTTMKNYE